MSHRAPIDTTCVLIENILIDENKLSIASILINECLIFIVCSQQNSWKMALLVDFHLEPKCFYLPTNQETLARIVLHDPDLVKSVIVFKMGQTRPLFVLFT